MSPKEFTAAIAISVTAALAGPVGWGQGAEPATALTGVALPEGYRQWTAVAPSHRLDKGQMRLMLANEIMVKAYRASTLPFPEGSTIAKLSYKAEASKEWKDAVVPGEPATVEIITKDSKKYPDTGGWGFGRFSSDGRPLGDAELYKTCFPCHQANVEGHDFIFTRWAP